MYFMAEIDKVQSRYIVLPITELHENIRRPYNVARDLDIKGLLHNVC